MVFNEQLTGYLYRSILQDKAVLGELSRFLMILRKYSISYGGYCKDAAQRFKNFHDKGLGEFNRKIDVEINKLKKRYPTKLEKVGRGKGDVAGWKFKDASIKHSFMIDVYDNFWRTLITNYLPNERTVLVWMHNMHLFVNKAAFELKHDANSEAGVSTRLKELITVAQMEIKEAENIEARGYNSDIFADEAKVIINKNKELIKDAENLMILTQRFSQMLLRLVLHIKKTMKQIRDIEALFGVRKGASYAGISKMNEDVYKRNTMQIQRALEKLSGEFEAITKSIKIRRPVKREIRLLKEMARDENRIGSEIIKLDRKTRKRPAA